MAPLITLFGSFLILRLAFNRWLNARYAGQLALSVMLFLTASGHFVQTEALAQMVPPQIPNAFLIIYMTGVMELVFAILLLIPKNRTIGLIIAAFLSSSYQPISTQQSLRWVWVDTELGIYYLESPSNLSS